MTPVWTALPMDIVCGTAAGPHVIPAGQPVRLIAGAIRRCADHAHAPVDWVQVDAARARLDAVAAAETAPAEPRTPRPSPRIPAPRRPRSSDFIRVRDLFDPKALAAGDRSGE